LPLTSGVDMPNLVRAIGLGIVTWNGFSGTSGHAGELAVPQTAIHRSKDVRHEVPVERNKPMPP
jgi:hypothetical protein